MYIYLFFNNHLNAFYEFGNKFLEQHHRTRSFIYIIASLTLSLLNLLSNEMFSQLLTF